MRNGEIPHSDIQWKIPVLRKQIETVVTVMSIWIKQRMQKCRTLPFYQLLPYKWISIHMLFRSWSYFGRSAFSGARAFSRSGRSETQRNSFEIVQHGERKCSRRFNYLNYHTKKFLTICPSRVTWIIAPFLFRFLLCKHSHLAYPRVCCNTKEPALQQFSDKIQNRCAWVYLRKRGGRVVLRCRSKFSRWFYCHFEADFFHSKIND